MNSYEDNRFQMQVVSGDLCKGENCDGWYLSDNSHWFPCGHCNPFGEVKPYPEEEDNTF